MCVSAEGAIIVMRHGDTEYNQDLTQPCLASDLTIDGRRHVEASARLLVPSLKAMDGMCVVLASPTGRTLDTANTLARVLYRAQVNVRLMRGMGEYPSEYVQPVITLAERTYQRSACPDRRRMYSMFHRSLYWILRRPLQRLPLTIVLVTHGGLTESLVHVATGLPETRLGRGQFLGCHVTQTDVRNWFLHPECARAATDQAFTHEYVQSLLS